MIGDKLLNACPFSIYIYLYKYLNIQTNNIIIIYNIDNCRV